jgi:sulfonate transport system substrate-binding protein
MIFNVKKNITLAGFLLAAISFVFGLLTDAQAADSAKEVRIATVAYNVNGKVGFNGSAAIVEKQGWLKGELAKQGVKLTWVPVTAQSVGVTVNEAFANKSIDFAGYGDLPSVILNSGGVETRIVVPGGRGNNVYLVVSPNSTAKSLVDLKGKRIALHRGRPWEITFARYVESNGLKFSDFKISNLNPGAGAAALAAGNVDAFVTLSDAYQLEDKKVGKIIWSTKASAQDWKMRAELWGAKGFIAQNPAITQAVATAYIKAAHWTSQQANFDEYLKVANQNGQPEDVFRREYADDSVAWKSRWSPLFDDLVLDHYANVAQYSRKANLIRKDLNTSQLFEPRFLNAALKVLKLEGYWQPRKTAAKAS